MRTALGSFDASTPWLAACAGTGPLFEPSTLAILAQGILSLQLNSLTQVKAFRTDNSADAFFYSGNDPLMFICWNEACGELAQEAWGEPEATLEDALEHTQGPIAAKVSTAPYAPLSKWLKALDRITARPCIDADAYCTDASALSTASLGWHVDDVAVLFVALRGRKRFRVAGRTIGSPVVIDHVLEPGDALFIPALTFHTGGGDETHGGGFGLGDALTRLWARPRAAPQAGARDGQEGSLLLSVALPWIDAADEEEALAATASWREMIEDLANEELPARFNTWDWAASRQGQELLHTEGIISLEALRRFVDEE